MNSRLLPLAFVLLSTSAWGSTDTNGSNGIDSIATGLDGTGVSIGQGDVNRSAKFGYDTMAEFRCQHCKLWPAVILVKFP